MRAAPTARLIQIPDSDNAPLDKTDGCVHETRPFSSLYLGRTLMDHDSLLLIAEFAALVVLGALGIWRIYRHENTNERDAPTPDYDMRRDGQRLST